MALPAPSSILSSNKNEFTDENLQMPFPTTKPPCFDIIPPGHEAPWAATFHGQGMGQSHAFKITVAVSCELCLGVRAGMQSPRGLSLVPEGQQCHPTVPAQPPRVPISQLHHLPCGTSQRSTKDPCPKQKGVRHQQKEESDGNAQIIPEDSRSYVQNKPENSSWLWSKEKFPFHLKPCKEMS